MEKPRQVQKLSQCWSKQDPRRGNSNRGTTPPAPLKFLPTFPRHFLAGDSSLKSKAGDDGGGGGELTFSLAGQEGEESQGEEKPQRRCRAVHSKEKVA